MAEFPYADTLHRLVKEAIDSGAAASIAEAEAMFRGFRLGFTIDQSEADDVSHQIALLTGVALARRVFLGGVSVSGALSAPLRIPFPLAATIGEAVVNLGGSIRDHVPGDPVVTIGGAPLPQSEGFHVRTAYGGWRGGIVPG